MRANNRVEHNRKSMRVALLVFVLLLGNIPMQVEATSGRAITAEVVLSDYVWNSDDTIPIEVYVTGAPFNRNITLVWELSDENGIVMSETIIFQMSASNHVVQFEISEFYSGGTYHDLNVEVSFRFNSCQR